MLLEVLGEGALVSLEGDVADEEGLGGRVLDVAELGGAVVLLLLGSLGVVVAGSGEVDTEATAVKLVAVTALEGLGTGLGVGELDVTEALAAARVTVGDDADALELAELLELAGEPLFVDVPAKIADEQVGGSLLLLTVDDDLDLLLGRLGGLLGLALLAGGLLLLLLLIVGRGVAVGVGVWVAAPGTGIAYTFDVLPSLPTRSDFSSRLTVSDSACGCRGIFAVATVL